MANTLQLIYSDQSQPVQNSNAKEQMLQDLRYALRPIRKSPAFAAVAILTLALGIGANTAIFTLLDQALLRRLPVSHPEQLVRLRFTGASPGHVESYGGDDKDYFSYPVSYTH